MVIKITGLPGTTVKFLPLQEQLGAFTVGNMQAVKKKEKALITIICWPKRHVNIKMQV